MSPSRENLLNIILLFFITLQIYVAQISNYTLLSFLIKSGLLLLIIPLFRKVLIFSYPSLKSFFETINHNIKILLLFIITIPLITIIYSKNPLFGLQKWINIIIGLIPSVILAYFIKENIKVDILEKFFTILLMLSFFTSILFFIKNPFTYKGYYNLTNFEFSHVIFSRFISPLILCSYYKILISDNIKKVFYFSFTASILTITLIYTSHRATTIGLILSLIILLILSKQKLTNNNLIIFIGVLIVSLLIVTKFNLIEKRNYELIDFVLSNKTTDASINTRLELYKISFELIKKNPVTGIGFGGFKSYYKSDLPMKLKYPHNLFLETQVELGIIGSILLFALIYLILKNTIKYSRLIFVFALFSLWLSLFSKDLTTQNLLFINIIFINNRNHNHN